MVLKAKRKKPCSGPSRPGSYRRMRQSECCLVVSLPLQRPSMPLSGDSPYQHTFQRVVTAKCTPRDCFETSPYLSHSDIFLLNHCSIYCLSAPDWMREKKLFFGARHFTRLYLIFTTFLWGKYSCFTL